MKIYEAAELLRKNKISPPELAKEVLGKIAEKEKDVKAYITICDDILEKAREAERNKNDSLLWGIPVAVKDNICTKGLRTTAASRMLEEFVPPYDATVVKRLKEEGAIIIGKTNMDEFGMGSDSKQSAFQMTVNPVNYAYVPGGSSGGSGAAVKSGMALGALGTDTGGSVRQPASFCGVYALKPTWSLVSRFGLIAFSSSLDCIGPMANSVKDLAIMTDAIAGWDKKDATSSKREKEEYYKNLTPSVKGLRIGVPKPFLVEADESIRKAVIKAAEKLKEMGAEVSECEIPSAKYAVSAYYIISSSEASGNLARYDGVKYGYRAKEYDDYTDMCIKSRSEAFGSEVKRRIILGTYALSRGGELYRRAVGARELIKRDFEKLFEKYDVILTPTSPCVVPKVNAVSEIEKKYEKDVCTASVSLAGLPAVNVPFDKDENGMPIGLQLVGNRFTEQMLLNAALSFEEGGCGDV
ncbi:MAG: Asp-tRNA(Asn)/Glu-tRNA(Gln) amidotransferase subunit GatA [Clostridia bacterium]|nr:Asp-tRNA(Asn)/Glu-tRNA(Gln) amidotransferase subunit GatA [Clostridia bacterium]